MMPAADTSTKSPVDEMIELARNDSRVRSATRVGRDITILFAEPLGFEDTMHLLQHYFSTSTIYVNPHFEYRPPHVQKPDGVYIIRPYGPVKK